MVKRKLIVGLIAISAAVVVSFQPAGPIGSLDEEKRHGVVATLASALREHIY
jgi:hypothetical protein